MAVETYGPYVNVTNSTLSNQSLSGALENANVVASAATGTLNIDTLTSGVWFYTVNATGNPTINFRGNASTTLNAFLGINQSISVVLLITNGSTAYYPTAFQIDGASVTPKWLNGIAPATGNASSIDGYNFTIIKTGAATYTVLGTGSHKFA